MSVRAGAMAGASLFNSKAGNSSGPLTLCGFKFDKRKMIPSVVISVGEMSG